ncbi:MAG: aminoacyl-tRNA hydrolase [Longimicrobiales bacterium]
MKVVCGLGNPGPEYEATRHNVGWWLVDRARDAWGFPAFRREGIVRLTEGRLDGRTVVLVKPQTYMNRSGAALAPLGHLAGFDVARDLLIAVDDVALDVGRVRFRAAGSSGGHNGLRSIEAALRSRDYARLRIGVGGAPPDADLAGWVLSDFEAGDEEAVRALIPGVVEGVRIWLEEGTEAAARRCNR